MHGSMIFQDKDKENITTLRSHYLEKVFSVFFHFKIIQKRQTKLLPTNKNI